MIAAQKECQNCKKKSCKNCSIFTDLKAQSEEEDEAKQYFSDMEKDAPDLY